VAGSPRRFLHQPRMFVNGFLPGALPAKIAS